MSNLSIKNFGKAAQEGSTSLDLSSLESNPRYNQEGNEQESNEQEGQEQESNEQEGQEQESNEQESQEQESNEQESNEQEGQEQESNEQESQEQETNTQSEVTEEQVFKSLSEKLGREITSYEDLETKEQVELDPEVKAINEWKQRTGRPIEDFFKFQKDYTKSSDLDIAREFLQLEYPSFNASEIDLELENYLPNEDDLDNEAARRALNLKKYAAKGRKELENLRGELGEPSTASYTPEVNEQLKFAREVKSQIDSNMAQQKSYSEGINKAAMSTESLKMNLSDDLSIDFKISDKDKKSLPSLIEEMPHWRTADGKWNHEAVVQDAIKIKHFDAMVKLAYEQGLNSGKDDLLKKAKNSTLGANQSSSGQQGVGTKKPIIENLDKMLGGQRLTMKFGNKK